MLQRMRELSVLSANDTYSVPQRSFMDMEFQQLKKQIVQIANNTEWNGFPILNGSTGIPMGHQSKTTGLGSFALPNSPATTPPSYTLPTLSDQDLVVNGIPIGIPQAVDDAKTAWSPSSDYRAYSAIAKAAAINAKIQDTGGVRATVQANLMSGAAMSQVTSALTAQVHINGITIDLALTPNDTATARSNIIRAINTKTPETGVIAKDTGHDATGIQLIAADGRNIEVQLDAALVGFAGLKSGLQLGNIVLTTPSDTNLNLTSPSGEIASWGLNTGHFESSLSRSSTTSRNLSAVPSPYPVLQAGDLKINGFAIRATTVADDTFSKPKSIAPTSDKLSSAIALAAAINDSRDQTKVTALAVGPLLSGPTASATSGLVGASGTVLLNLNKTGISISIANSDTSAQRLQKVLAAVNSNTSTTGVQASTNNNGGVDLTTVDGRNLTINASLPANMVMADLGLSSAINTTETTYYGTVTMQSESPFKVEPGELGYGSNSNFLALGFTEGNFGAESAGRLNFQVGARKYQTITIDMPDFGNNGPLTGLVTSDVKLTTPIVDIKTPANATKSTSILDQVLQNVNEARATMGAVVNRLNHAMDNLSNVVLNTTESRSKIEDTDYASASSEVARRQIIQQAATAVLAQANASQQFVLKLLQQ
jgi:flagellin